MSDVLLDVVNQWQQHLQLILPVTGAILLVIAVYLCSLTSTSPPPLVLVDEPVTTKKEKALAKKKLKQQLKQKQKPSNGHVVEEAKSSERTEKPKPVESKKTLKKEKMLQKPAQSKDVKTEAAQVPSRRERAQMKKEAEQGDWVTVVSSKERKAKQAQQVVAETEQLTEDARQAIIEEALSLVAEKEAAKKKQGAVKSQDKPKPESITKSSSSKKVEKASNPLDSASSKKKSGQKSEVTTTPDIPVSAVSAAVQPDVRPKETKTAAPSPQTAPPAAEGDMSLQEKLAEAMQPAFDELGDWEEAKPMKAKNVKKRARRDK